MPKQEIKKGVKFAAEAHEGQRDNTRAIKGKLSDSQKDWYRKQAYSPDVGRCELVAQEMLRFFVLHQPETRIEYGKESCFLYSEDVRGKRTLPKNEAHNFKNGVYTGLGQALVLAMFLQEADLNQENLLLDDHNRVTKIDGDWSFAAIRDDPEGKDPGLWSCYKITEKSIAALPYPDLEGYVPRFWLDIIVKEVFRANSAIMDRSVTIAPKFREEVNEAIVKICLLPNDFITSFIKDNFSSEAPKSNYKSRFSQTIPITQKMLFDLITSRREALMQAAIKNPDFQNYVLKNPDKIAESQLWILERIKEFRTKGFFSRGKKDSSQVQERLNSLKSLIQEAVLNQPESSQNAEEKDPGDPGNKSNDNRQDKLSANPFGALMSQNPLDDPRQLNPFEEQVPKNPFDDPRLLNPFEEQVPKNPFDDPRLLNSFEEQVPKNPFDPIPLNPFGEPVSKNQAESKDNDDPIANQKKFKSEIQQGRPDTSEEACNPFKKT